MERRAQCRNNATNDGFSIFGRPVVMHREQKKHAVLQRPGHSTPAGSNAPQRHRLRDAQSSLLGHGPPGPRAKGLTTCWST